MSMRKKLGYWVEGQKVQRFMVVLIIINALIIGLETYPEQPYLPNTLLRIIDDIILVLFVLEMAIKLYAFRWRFFWDSWNIFDFFIVLISLIPLTASLSIVRTLRILRTLRLLKKLTKLRIIIESLLQAVPSISWISALLLMVFYVFGVIGTHLFGQEFPKWFGTLDKTLYTLFQVMTLESWSMGISRPVMEKFPYAFAYFIPFIIVATYTGLNIFIAVVVSAMNEIHKFEEESSQEPNFILNDNLKLQEEIEQLKTKLDRIENMLAESLKNQQVHHEVLNKVKTE